MVEEYKSGKEKAFNLVKSWKLLRVKQTLRK